MTEEEDETGRRIVSVVHLAMLAAVPLYALLLWFLRDNAALTARRPDRPNLVFVLLAIGAAEWGAATLLGRHLLRAAGPGAGAAERVRRYFLVRFAAAEAIAVFGLFAGFTGTPLPGALLLFAASAFALLASTPTRSAYARAVGETRPGGR